MLYVYARHDGWELFRDQKYIGRFISLRELLLFKSHLHMGGNMHITWVRTNACSYRKHNHAQ